MSTIEKSYADVLRFVAAEAIPTHQGDERSPVAWGALVQMDTEHLMHLIGVLYVEVLMRCNTGEISDAEGGSQFRQFAQQLLNSDFGQAAWANAQQRRPQRAAPATMPSPPPSAG
jgi:hypothetical protein